MKRLSPVNAAQTNMSNKQVRHIAAFYVHQLMKTAINVMNKTVLLFAHNVN